MAFQERALRQYFRNLTVNDDGLRSSSSSAHLIIFNMIVTILTADVASDPTHKADSANNALKQYAADFWVQHFLDIQVESLNDEEVKNGIEGLSAIVQNQGRALEKIEENASDTGIFGEAADLREHVLASIKAWSTRAANLPPETLSANITDWAHMIADNPSKLMEGIARQHVYNWFNYADNVLEAQRSFQFAAYALKLVIHD